MPIETDATNASASTAWAACASPLLFCHGLAGDLLLALPTLRALHHLYGDRLTLVCGTEPFVQEFFSSLGFQRRIGIEFRSVRGEEQAEDADVFYAWSFDAELLQPRLLKVDLLINLCFESGPSFDTLVRQLGVPSIGFHRDADVAKLPLVLPPGVTAWDRCFPAALAIDPFLAFNNFAWLPQHPEGPAIRQALAAQLKGAELLVVHADTKIDKMWPLGHWKELLAQLLEHDPQLHVVMLGYPLLPFDSYGEHERLIDCRDLTLMASFEVVGMSNWFIGIDSCMLHAADLARVPGIGIFTHRYPAEKFGFRFSASQALQGSNPPRDVDVASVRQAFDALRREHALRRPVSHWPH